MSNLYEKITTIAKYRKTQVYLIYQMGKVASMSIYKSMQNLGLNVYHRHSFYNGSITELFKKYRAMRILRRITIFRKIKSSYNDMKSLMLIKLSNQINIITIVREPISRNMSMYFQGIQIVLAERYMFHSRKISEETNIRSLINDFYDNFDHRHGICWFDNELKRSFGIDVYEYDFDNEKGYGIIQKDKIRVLILKMERINDLEGVVSEFIGDPKYKMISENISKDKWYSSIYNEFRDSIRFDEAYIDSLYNSKYMDHFYSDEEKREFAEKLMDREGH